MSEAEKLAVDGETSGAETGGWAVCCSGGGIRSAAYCLGALQSLDGYGLLAKAKWILGVSGGSYIAASRALVQHGLDKQAVPEAEALPEAEPGLGAYAPGSAEERNLRFDTRYLAPDGPVISTGVLSLLTGVIAILVTVLAPLYAVTHAWGWLLRWRHALVPAGQSMTADVTATAWWLVPVAVAGVAVLLFGWWRARLEPGGGGPRLLAWRWPEDRDGEADRAWLVSLALLAATGLAIAMLATPEVIAWLSSVSGALGAIARFIGFGPRPTWSWSAAAGVVTAVIVVGKYCQTGLSKWAAAAAGTGAVAQAAAWSRQVLLPWAASVVIVAAGALLALRWVSDGARAGFTAGQLAGVAAAAAVTLLCRVAVDVNRQSMHDFYRWRLADAFAVTRAAAEAAGGSAARGLFAKAAKTRLSQLAVAPAPKRPGLVICGTANINAAREVPPGRGGFCLTFDPQHVTLHREEGQAAAVAKTADYESLLDHRRCTLFDISAISGAAISPLMGAATQRAHRILFTAANVRLGVWLPHPVVVSNARELTDHKDDYEKKYPSSWWERRPLLLLAWYLRPHLTWKDGTAAADDDLDVTGGDDNLDVTGRDAVREARLWAHVLQLREQGAKCGRSSWPGALWYRLMQPTLGLLWAEAAGELSYRATWMYVTDGGHYDNLGLVAALRQGASRIVVLDAAGDKADTWSTIGGAIALARTDLGIEIDLDPSKMRPGGAAGDPLVAGQVVLPWAYGQFHRTWAGQEDKPASGEIWVCKLGWWDGAPWDVRAYASQHPTYPCDSTLEQWYDAPEFAAYQELGAAAVRAATGLTGPALPAVPLPRCPADGPADAARSDGGLRV
jgi:hypothetical protein